MSSVAADIRIAEIVVGDEPESWRSAGFSVDDDGTCQIGEVCVRLAGRGEGKRIRSWGLRGLGDDAAAAILESDPPSLDGLATSVISEPTDRPSATHPNGVSIIDHIVLLTPDTRRTVAAIESLGLPAKRTRETDQYGAPFLQTFFRAGEVIIELIGPAEPSGDGPAGFFGLAYTVDDLDATAAMLGPGLHRIKDAVQPGRRIATLDHKSFDMSVATAFMSGGAAADGIDGTRPGGAPAGADG